MSFAKKFKIKKKKKDKVAQQNGIIDVQRKNTRCTVQKHCTRIRAFIYKKKEYKSMIEKKKVHIEQTKSIITFTHSPNKCHNIFTKHLFLVVVGHSFIFYYFIFTYKKLTSQ